MANVFDIKTQHAFPPLFSLYQTLFSFSPQILNIWLPGLHQTAASQVLQASALYTVHTLNIYACLSLTPYLLTLAEKRK